MEKCCCFSVRTACLVFGGFTLVGSLLQLYNDGSEVGKFWNGEDEREAAVVDFQEKMSAQNIYIDREDIRTLFIINHYLAIPNLLLGLAGVAGGCLMLGVIKEMKNCLVPCILVFLVDIMLRICILFAILFLFGVFHPITMWTYRVSQKKLYIKFRFFSKTLHHQMA